MILSTLLTVHIVAGSVSLLMALAALIATKGKRIHIISGRIYASAMTLVFFTSLPLSIYEGNVFLLLIALFSFYLVFAGWRFARNRRGHPHWVDWTAMFLMGFTGLGMWIYSIIMLTRGEDQWVTMLVFGCISMGLTLADGRFYLRSAKGRSPVQWQRIQRHLTGMMAGTIATVTAVMVVNVDLGPVWLPWLLSTIVISPLIVWWNVRIALKARR